jgi:hypothetical protein
MNAARKTPKTPKMVRAIAALRSYARSLTNRVLPAAMSMAVAVIMIGKATRGCIPRE